MNSGIPRVRACFLAATLILGTLVWSVPTAHADEPLFTPSTYPLVDGAIPAQSLASAYKQAFTGQASPQDFSGTQVAYKHLIDGLAGLILVPMPTDEQRAAAKAKAVDLEVIPVANDALTFLTGIDGVDSLNLDQIRDVYAGRITNWSDLGGTAGQITAYQRPTDSDSGRALLDLVMGGTSVMNPPTVPGTNVVASFDGSPGALGYSYYHYATAIWGEVIHPRDGGLGPLKFLDVNGIAATTSSIQSGTYPVTIPYYIVINGAEPQGSPVRNLVDAIKSVEGQSVTMNAGYVPVAPAVLPQVVPQPTPESDPARLLSLDEIYSLNSLIVTTAPQYLRASGGHCALVERLSVSGLRNPAPVEARITEFSAQQDAYLTALWGVNSLSSTDSCSSAEHESLHTTVMSSFANLLSVVSTASVGNPIAVLNLRLDTGERLQFADLFVKGTKTAALIDSSVGVEVPWAGEEAVVAWARSLKDVDFSFTSIRALVYVRDGSMEAAIPVEFAPRWQSLALFNLATQATSLYSSTESPLTCPVLTYRVGEYCWTGEDHLWDSFILGYGGGVVDVPIIVKAGQQWRVIDTEALDPESLTGVGPTTVVVRVPQNRSDSVRSLKIGIEVKDPSTLLAYMAHVNIVQAGMEPAADAATLTLSSSSVRVSVDSCGSDVVLTPETIIASATVLDGFGQPRANVPIEFSSAQGLVIAQSMATTDENGVASVAGVLDSRAILMGERPTVSATMLVHGRHLDISGSPAKVDVELDVPSAPQSTLTLTSQTTRGKPANGSSAYTLDVQLVDGCDLPTVGRIVEFVVDGSANLSADMVEVDAEGRAEVQVTSLVAETVSIRAHLVSVAEKNVESPPLYLSFAEPIPDIGQSSLSVESMASILCTGEGHAAIDLMIKDATGTPLVAQMVTLDTEGQASLSETMVLTDGRGMARIWLSDQVAETVGVRAMIADREIAGSPGMVTFLEGCRSSAPPTVGFTLDSGTKLANGHDGFSLTIYARDVNGGLVSGIADQIQVSVDSEQVQIASLVESSRGVYSTRITSTEAGLFTLRIGLESDGRILELTKSPTQIVFIPTWSTRVRVTADPDLSPVTGGLARASDGVDAYLITAEISAKMTTSPWTPLAGQAPHLGVLLTCDEGTAESVAAVFDEVQPGIYVARITATAPATSLATVEWTEPQADDVVQTKPMSVTFVDPTAVLKHMPTKDR